MLANCIAYIANSNARLEITLAAACIASHIIIVANIAVATKSALVAAVAEVLLHWPYRTAYIAESFTYRNGSIDFVMLCRSRLA